MEPTRKQYLDGEVTFEQFYRAVNQTAGLVFSPDHALMPRILECLEQGDEHLNRIPLNTWDRLASWAQNSLTRALKEHGDFYSLSGGVCCLKQAARDAAARVRGGN